MKPSPTLLNPTNLAAPGIHSFHHQAMACVFELFIDGEDVSYAEQVAWQVFDAVSRLEIELSRFLDCSDVTRVNDAGPGVMIPVGPAAWECLQLSLEIAGDTGGAFDVTLGAALERRRGEDRSINLPSDEETAAWRGPGMGGIAIDPATHSVGLVEEGLRLDFGAVGKGYALDTAVGILHDWSVESALIHSGQSTVVGVGAPTGQPGWITAIRSPDGDEILGVVDLQGHAFSGSGIRLHGHHIIDPRTGRAAAERLGAWVLAPSAARSDALSTAFMVMDLEDIETYCASHPDIGALVLSPGDSHPALHTFGALDGVELAADMVG